MEDRLAKFAVFECTHFSVFLQKKIFTSCEQAQEFFKHVSGQFCGAPNMFFGNDEQMPLNEGVNIAENAEVWSFFQYVCYGEARCIAMRTVFLRHRNILERVQ